MDSARLRLRGTTRRSSVGNGLRACGLTAHGAVNAIVHPFGGMPSRRGDACLVSAPRRAICGAVRCGADRQYHAAAARRGVVMTVTKDRAAAGRSGDRKSTRLNSSHLVISYAVFCLKKKK